MSGSSLLTNSVVDLASIKEYDRRQLKNLLDSLKGPKNLVLDPQLSGPLGLISEVSLLKEHDVDKIFHLAPVLETDCPNIIYLIRPRPHLCKYICNHIHSFQGQKLFKTISVYFVPTRRILCDKIFEDAGLLEDITFGEYNLDIIPFDDDVITLELQDDYREVKMEGNRHALFQVAKSIMKLQSLFGFIPTIRGKGQSAKLVLDMILRMRRELHIDTMIQPEIDQLILIDRECDLVTPMCTMLTYEGLIDEIIGIRNSSVEIDAEIANPKLKESLSNDKGKKIKVPLNNNDTLFAETRDLNFCVVGPLLHKKAKEINDYYKTRHDAKTVTEIRDFMKKLSSTQQEHNALRIHTHLADKILQITKEENFHQRLEIEQSLLTGADISSNTIEDMINKKEPLQDVLRVLSLQALTTAGPRIKVYEQIKRDIIQTYGFEALLTLENLEKLGILRRQDMKNIFPLLRKNFRLVIGDCDDVNPDDMAYVHSGYAPLSCRIAEAALTKKSWDNIEDILNIIPGPTITHEQTLSNEIQQNNQRGVTLVFFLGGITFAEMSALRFAAQKESSKTDILIATTKLLNGRELIESFFEYLG